MSNILLFLQGVKQKKTLKVIHLAKNNEIVQTVEQPKKKHQHTKSQ